MPTVSVDSVYFSCWFIGTCMHSGKKFPWVYVYICHNILVYSVTVFLTLFMFPRSDVTNYHRLGGLKQEIFFLSRSSEGHNPKVKVQARLIPFEDSEKECIMCLSPSFWWLRVFFAFFDFPCRHITSISDSILTLWWFNC